MIGLFCPHARVTVLEWGSIVQYLRYHGVTVRMQRLHQIMPPKQEVVGKRMEGWGIYDTCLWNEVGNTVGFSRWYQHYLLATDLYLVTITCTVQAV